MAKIHTLTYNGTKSSDLGVFVTGSGSFDAAELDVDKYEIPGRNGDLILSNNRYKNIEITYPAFIPKAFMDKAQNVRNWLRSSRVYARLEDTYDTDHYRLGIPTGVQSFEPANRNDGANFEMTFDCKPQRFWKAGETPETVEADVQTASGEIVTFETVAESPMTSAEVSLSPQQSGSGDPSPTNIRPISGHTGAELIRTGKNLAPKGYDNETTVQGVRITPTENGVKVVGTVTSRFALSLMSTSPSNRHVPLAAGEKVTFSLFVSGDISVAEAPPFIGYYANNVYGGNIGNLLQESGYKLTWTVTEKYANADDSYVRAYVYLPANAVVDFEIGFMMELGSSATAYEPYQGDTYSVTFSDQGTVYGGTFDFVSGKLRVTWTARDIGTLDWTYDLSVPRFYTTELNNSVKFPANNDVQANCLSSMYKNTTFNKLYTREKKNGTFAFGTTGTLSVINTAYTNVADFKSAMIGVQVAYELATPLEYTLSPQQIETLLGENNVWSDAGPITLTYAEPYTIENPTIFDARPLFTVTNPAEGDVIMVNGQAITFVDGYSGTVFIDCETMNAYSGAANLNSIIEATDFPVLVPGTNIITWTGTGVCTMTPRWWEL